MAETVYVIEYRRDHYWYNLYHRETCESLTLAWSLYDSACRVYPLTDLRILRIELGRCAVVEQRLLAQKKELDATNWRIEGF